MHSFSKETVSVQISGNISYYRTEEKYSVTDILDSTGKIWANGENTIRIITKGYTNKIITAFPKRKGVK